MVEVPVDPAQRARIRAELSRILASPALESSQRAAIFLEHVVSRVLEGRAGEIKEVTIGVEAFGFPPGYDTKADARVRTAAVTLRKKLNEYYLGIGAGDPIRIELPKGTYIPSFREIKLETASETAPLEPVRILRPRLRTLLAVMAGVLIVALVLLLIVRATPRVEERSIAVTPFHNQDPKTQYLTDGLTEEVKEDLSRLPGLRVLARVPDELVRSPGGDYRSLGRRLGVGVLLLGELRTVTAGSQSTTE